jgi:hypothetical protein
MESVFGRCTHVLVDAPSPLPRARKRKIYKQSRAWRAGAFTSNMLSRLYPTTSHSMPSLREALRPPYSPYSRSGSSRSLSVLPVYSPRLSGQGTCLPLFVDLALRAIIDRSKMLFLGTSLTEMSLTTVV